MHIAADRGRGAKQADKGGASCAKNNDLAAGQNDIGGDPIAGLANALSAVTGRKPDQVMKDLKKFMANNPTNVANDKLGNLADLVTGMTLGQTSSQDLATALKDILGGNPRNIRNQLNKASVNDLNNLGDALTGFTSGGNLAQGDIASPLGNALNALGRLGGLAGLGQPGALGQLGGLGQFGALPMGAPGLFNNMGQTSPLLTPFPSAMGQFGAGLNPGGQLNLLSGPVQSPSLMQAMQGMMGTLTQVLSSLLGGTGAASSVQGDKIARAGGQLDITSSGTKSSVRTNRILNFATKNLPQTVQNGLKNIIK